MSSAQLAGIDVSKWQGAVDWPRVKASGVVFAFARATYGAKEVDADFAANWRAMRDAGVVRGAYHFFVTHEDAAAQAELFVKTVGRPEAGDLPPVLDVEAESGAGANLVEGVKTWLAAVEQGLGRKPIIYTAPSFWNENMTDEFGAYPLWVAEYGVSEPRPVKGWTTWTFWQYSQGGSVAGVNGTVDLDRFKGSAADLAALCASAPTAAADSSTPDSPTDGGTTADDTTTASATTTVSTPPVNQPAPAATNATTAAHAQTYTVRPGDTLDRIAELHGTTVAAICRANHIADPNRIDAGQVLTIPS